jgi:UDP-N-acetylglucosamine 2-epimerase (non-hydrolysing)
MTTTPRTILTIFGTRPEAIKLAPVIHQLQVDPEHFHCVVAVTAQHREMLDQVLSLFHIAPDFDLDIMQANQSLFDVTTRALAGLQPILERVRPDFVLVQGDTTTAFVAALAAYYLKIPIGHVEAGLRTHDKYQPFPEEINRRLISALADLNFAPTEQARQNLLQEGIPDARIFVTGNTVIDALLATARESHVFTDPPLSQMDFQARRVILVTAHRRENFGEPIANICAAIRRIAEAAPDVEIIFSVHRNPNVRGVVNQMLGDLPRVHLIEPLDYAPFVHLMARCTLILTDSGGVQEEAPSLGKPVLVLRNVTERPEGVLAGTLRMVGANTEKIVQAAVQLLTNDQAYAAMARASNPYGDGKASLRIASLLREYFSSRAAGGRADRDDPSAHVNAPADTMTRT